MCEMISIYIETPGFCLHVYHQIFNNALMYGCKIPGVFLTYTSHLYGDDRGREGPVA